MSDLSTLEQRVAALAEQVAGLQSAVDSLRREIAPLTQFRLGAKGVWWFISAICMIGVAIAAAMGLFKK